MQGVRIKDPILRKRLALSGGETPSNKWVWLIILLIVLWLGAGIWFFYPELKPYVDPYLKDILPPSNEQSQPDTTASPPTSVATTELAAETDNAANIDSTNAPVEMPEVTETVAPAVEIAPPVQAVTLSEQDIEQLIKTAESQIKRTRFTSPEGDNAYETYQKIHAANAEKAQPILNQIVHWYKQQADEFIGKSEIVQPIKENALTIYKKLEEIAPEHETVATLRAQLLDIFDRRADFQLRKDYLTEPEDDNVYATYSALSSLAPQRPATQKLFKTLITKMVKQAKNQVAQHKYTTPEGDNAYETYRKILDIDVNNNQAQQGVKDLAKQYYLLAIARKNSGHKDVSLEMIEKGLLLEPDSEALLKLRKELDAPPQHPLLKEGQQQVISGHLMYPLGNNAYVTYQKLVKEDKIQATILLEEIAEKYHSIADKQYRQGKTEKSLATINEGLSLTPRDEALKELKKKILKRLSE